MIVSEIWDKIIAAQHLRAEYAVCGLRIGAADADGDKGQALALTTRRALFPVCLLAMLIDAALQAQQVVETLRPAGAWEQERAGLRDVINRLERAYLQAADCPDAALAQADACMPLVYAVLERLL